MIKNRYGLGVALDRLTQVFPYVTVTDLEVEVWHDKNEHPVATVGYDPFNHKKAQISVNGLTAPSEIKAILEYAEVLEELANPVERR